MFVFLWKIVGVELFKNMVHGNERRLFSGPKFRAEFSVPQKWIEIDLNTFWWLGGEKLRDRNNPNS